MKSKENLVFLGMMGSGKTSVGLIVSKKLKSNFFDIDEEIEKECGIKIFKIFETKGEAFFRKIEEDITLKVLKKSNCVISLGGGAFLNKNIKHEILENHLSFWLNWDEKTLINRIKNSKKRPLAFNAKKNELVEIIRKRSNIYSKARYKVECEKFTKNQIAEKILNIYETC
jgi:shikimate kinase/shikimate kinase/3-dehydroquinate synthase